MKKGHGEVSRRGLLKSTAIAAIVAGSGSLMGQAPAVITARRFRGWVTRGGGTNRTTLQEMTLRAVSGRQIAVRADGNESLLFKRRCRTRTSSGSGSASRSRRTRTGSGATGSSCRGGACSSARWVRPVEVPEEERAFDSGPRRHRHCRGRWI
jgi:hypothetical protein